MERINLVELLKDCIGMELDCVIYDDVTLYRVDTSPENEYPIRIETKSGYFLDLTKYGTYSNIEEARCVIFPKGKTTWEGFQRLFEDGDITALDSNYGVQLFIFKEYIHNHGYAQCYMMLDCDGKIDSEGGRYYVERFATEEEKQKLFDAIKANGYKWNAETRTLEDLVVEPVFKDGDVIVDKYGAIVIYKQVYNSHEGSLVDFHCGLTTMHSKTFFIKDRDSLLQYCGEISSIRFATEEEKQILFNSIKENGYEWNSETKTLEKVIGSRFKVGDKIKLKGGDEFGIITQVTDCFYTIKNKNHTHCWPIKKQDDWELVPDKFDITTLVPFESKVLVRNRHDSVWTPAFWGYYSKEYARSFVVAGGDTFEQCIPYEGNEHLLNSNKDCDECYKIWRD